MDGETTAQAELVFIRHAPVRERGRLFGRTDAVADVEPGDVAHLLPRLGAVERVVVSPAKRCVASAEAIWPDRNFVEDARLWEQDFGAHDGLVYADLPDIGQKNNAELSAYRPPEGESFDDLYHRIAPAVLEWSKLAADANQRIAIVAHAGTVRGALGLALGHPPAGLSFEVEHLSMTCLRVGPEGPISIRKVNWR